MQRITDFWAAFFGLSPDDYGRDGVRVVPHAGLRGYQGAWLFQRAAASIISVTQAWVSPVQAAVRGQQLDGFSASDLTAAFGDTVEKVIGPAYQGFVERAAFRPVASSARMLAAGDEAALGSLARSCDPEEWEHSDIHSGQEPIFGCFADGLLVAACTYHRETGDAAASGIITHPAYRRRGYGRAVLSAATEHGLDSGYLMLYQTLVANRPAVATAEALGYEQHAVHYAFRLKSSIPPS